MLRLLKKNYHWLIAFLVFLEMIVYGGLINSASVFIQPISQELGVTTTAYSVAMMPYTITCFIGTCLSGYLFAHLGYKKTALASLVLISASLVLTANAHNLVVFSISKILFGMGYGACFTAGSVRIIKDWFWKHQGLVLGAVNMATGLGGSIMTIVLSSTIESSGWRMAMRTAARATPAGISRFLRLIMIEKIV
jgi:MFS family permease